MDHQNKNLLYSSTDLLCTSDNDTEFAEELSISSSKDLYEDRFQIDRTKLRRMMQSLNSTTQRKSEADLYFENIMKSTDTHIEWPRSYKSDTKCKQHPYVCITGSRLEDVTWAKGLVLAGLEVNNSFLRLKMAISNIDHSFILGRNNNNVNRIMDDTETHVQFPDSNQMKKENQVIVYGTLEGLESARILLRSSSPLLMSFELPMNQTIPFADKIGAYFKVQVMFSSSSKPNTSLVLIRGSVKRADKIKEATRSLLNSAFGKFSNSKIVSVQLDVPPQYQESMKGENCANIASIMEQTNTKIFFPELPTRGYKKSQVTITGTIDEVCVARQKLVASFPIELSFEIPDESGSATEIMNLGKRTGLSITISQKEREFKISVTIKGAERLMDKIYEVQRSVLKLKPIFQLEKSQPLLKMEQTDDKMERSDLAKEENLNEIWISNDQFANMSSPDSGYVSSASFRGGSQQSQCTVFDNQGPTNSHRFANTLMQSQFQRTSPGQCIPSYVDYLPSSYEEHHLLDNALDYNPAQREFVYSSDSNYGIGGDDWINQFNNILQIQEEERKMMALPIEMSTPNSPLIVGSEESVAKRLICTGWGNLF